MRIESRAVKKLLLIGVGSALAFTMSGVGTAQADSNGPIHQSTAAVALQNQLVSVGGSRCAGCHRAHTAQGEKLLKVAQPALCYTCHGGGIGSSLDVVNGSNDSAATGAPRALRGGGFAYALIDGTLATKTMPAILDQYAHPASNDVPVKATGTAVTSRHEIDGVTTGTMWGNGAISATVSAPLAAGKTGVKLECASCHDPHGNGNYRILKAVPNDATTKAVPSLGIAAVNVVPVAIPDATTKVYTTTNYWSVADRNVPTVTGGSLPLLTGTGITPNTATLDTTDSTDGNLTLVGGGATDGYITNVSQWCTTCHTRYLAASGSYNTLNKGYIPATSVAGVTTPGSNATTGITDATFTYRHRSDRADKEGMNVPNCIQCHVSHGSNVSMASNDGPAVTNPDGTATGTAGSGSMANSSRLLRVDNRGTCEMCHNV